MVDPEMSAFSKESGILPFVKRNLRAISGEPGIYLLLDGRHRILFIGHADLPLGLAREIEAQFNSGHWQEATHFKWAVARDPTAPERIAAGLIREFDPPFNRAALEALAY